MVHGSSKFGSFTCLSMGTASAHGEATAVAASDACSDLVFSPLTTDRSRCGMPVAPDEVAIYGLGPALLGDRGFMKAHAICEQFKSGLRATVLGQRPSAHGSERCTGATPARFTGVVVVGVLVGGFMNAHANWEQLS